jgi:serine/threonine protein kinase
MGSVYLAQHIDDASRRVALKVIRARASPEDQVRFVAEVRTLGRIAHPAVVGVVDCGREEGRQWLAMDLVDGETVATFIRPGGLEPRTARRWFLRLADALARVHELGIAHRDIKPSNIVVGDQGPILVDFGVARTLSEKRLTVAGLIPGTPAYMAPEMFEAEGPDPLAADVYALGQVFCELLMGRTLCGVDEQLSPNQALGRIVSVKLDLPDCDPGEQVDDALRRLVRLATAADPAQRPSAAELCAMLRQDVVRVAPTACPQPASPWPLVGRLAAVVLLSLLPTFVLGMGLPVYLMEEFELADILAISQLVEPIQGPTTDDRDVEDDHRDERVGELPAERPDDSLSVIGESDALPSVEPVETSRRPVSGAVEASPRIVDTPASPQGEGNTGPVGSTGGTSRAAPGTAGVDGAAPLSTPVASGTRIACEGGWSLAKSCASIRGNSIQAYIKKDN